MPREGDRAGLALVIRAISCSKTSIETMRLAKDIGSSGSASLGAAATAFGFAAAGGGGAAAADGAARESRPEERSEPALLPSACRVGRRASNLLRGERESRGGEGEDGGGIERRAPVQVWSLHDRLAQAHEDVALAKFGHLAGLRERDVLLPQRLVEQWALKAEVAHGHLQRRGSRQRRVRERDDDRGSTGAERPAFDPLPRAPAPRRPRPCQTSRPIWS